MTYASNLSLMENNSAISMSDHDFRIFSKFIHDNWGLKLPPSKKLMLQSRLAKRLKSLGLRSFSDYRNYLFSNEGYLKEYENLIDVVTTNKTDFFREPHQFNYLVEKALPDILRTKRSLKKEVRIWSAGCSTGEEPYTIAIVLSEYARRTINFLFRILATDVSVSVLEKATCGIYDIERIDPIPIEMKKKYFLRHKDHQKKIVKVAPILRNSVSFRKLNLMDENFGINKSLDVIFCRNVIIYFNRDTQERLLNKLCRHLSPTGYIFMGHSETLHSMDLPLKQVAPSIYRRML